MEMGARFPEQFISILHMNNAGFPSEDKSPATASRNKSLMFEEAAANLRI